LFIKPQTRGEVRAWVGAAAFGSVVGLAIGCAYLAGGMARDAVVHAQIQRLAGTASTGFRDVALNASAETDPGALAIARRHDPLASADLDPRERRIALLVDRLRSSKAVSPANALTTPSVPAGAAYAAADHSADQAAVLRARFATAGSASPFQLRGALDESRDLDCLAQAVYYEARGETPSGQAAVAQVVLNRVRHPSFPKSVCAVVFQGARTNGCQFSFACDGASHHPTESAAWRRAEQVAAKALNGTVMAEVGAATHFHVAGLSAEWGPHLLKVAQIGSHVFYRFGGHADAPGLVHRDVESLRPLDVKPVFASLGGLPSAEQAGHVLAAGAAAVEHAASVVENAAKAAVSPKPSEPASKPAVISAPAADEPVKTQVEAG